MLQRVVTAREGCLVARDAAAVVLWPLLRGRSLAAGDRRTLIDATGSWGLTSKIPMGCRPEMRAYRCVSPISPQCFPCFENLLMAVPRRRQTNRKTGSRRSHDFITPKQLTFCPNCGKAARTHRVCDNCGYYMGRIAVKTAE